MPSLILISAVCFVAYALVRYFNLTDIPKIKGLPEIPGVPVFGNLLQLGDSHPKVAAQWAKKYGPVFQTRYGNKVRQLRFPLVLSRRYLLTHTTQRVIFANTFESVKQLWIENQSALISRPTLHTFHTVVSSSQGFTIGTSPWDESCKARRKAAATALNRPAVQSYMPTIDLESMASIKEMIADTKGGTIDIDPIAYYQRFALNTSLTLAYGFRIQGNIQDELLQEITKVERQVSTFRSTSNNWQDYIPLMRLWPTAKTGPIEFRKRRDAYMDKLLNILKSRIAAGTDKPCIIGNILKDPEAKLNEGIFSPTPFSFHTIPTILTSPHSQPK